MKTWLKKNRDSKVMVSGVDFKNKPFLYKKCKNGTEKASLEDKICENNKPFTFLGFVRETSRTETLLNNVSNSNKENYFTSIRRSKRNSESDKPNDKHNSSTKIEQTEKALSTNAEDDDYETFEETDSNLSHSTSENKSDESFLSISTRQKHKYNCLEPNGHVSGLGKPLRLFNKSGKPLTDRVGQPLRDILGQPLVHLDDKGCLLCDGDGNQVFNSLGESAIYLTTNLRIPPSTEEPGIPLLDLNKKHVLFLYDDTGHPLTDGIGRPLLKASGNLMFGMSSGEKIDLNRYKNYQLKNVFGKAPLENFTRRIQIFSNDMKPLTDKNGKHLKLGTIICNKNGMPMCDENGRELFFKYGNRISHIVEESKSSNNTDQVQTCLGKLSSLSSVDKLSLNNCKIDTKSQENVSFFNSKIENEFEFCPSTDNQVISAEANPRGSHGPSLLKENELSVPTPYLPSEIKLHHKTSSLKLNEARHILRPSEGEFVSSKTNITYDSKNQTPEQKIYNQSEFQHEFIKHEKNTTGEAIILYDAVKKIKSQKSTLNPLMRNERICNKVIKKKPYSKMFKTNFFQCFMNTIHTKNLKQQDNTLIYNDYGMPLKDIYGNLLYDKYGIPLTGAGGKRLSVAARKTLRLKLRNIPVVPVSTESCATENKPYFEDIRALSYNKSRDQFGDPLYDKHGRPRFDYFGKLIYDFYGRPLTDAFGRPLIDGIGQPLMDSNGKVLTSVSGHAGHGTEKDVFGRPLYDKRGRALFDLYGRPRFDIFTNAIYDNCGRPVTDGDGNVLFDFMNKPIRPYPEKPLYKNVRAILPKYIDKILATPSLLLILKYSRSSLRDVFGGPLLDDFGRPLYNKIGKPCYDKYGRPLYDKNGRPLCDCYGRPLSDEIRRSPDDKTSSVVDSLKLLKLTKESSKWMEIKRSQTQTTKSSPSGVLDDAYVMKIVKPSKTKSTKYTFALTRVTTFTDGCQVLIIGLHALEILEAPLSPATAREMYRLPVDNKPMIMLARQRRIIKRKHRTQRC